MKAPNKQSIKSTRLPLLGLAAVTTVLAGCHDYVTATHEHEADYDTEVTYSVDRFETEFLVRNALVPYALMATGIDMVADPDAFLAPRSRLLQRHHVPIETTSTYLFDSGPCEFGGNTAIEATGTTETYDDAMTFVSMDVNASANDCKTRNWQGYVTLNSQLEFDVTGWYDDRLDEIASLDGSMGGSLRLKGDRTDVKFANIDSQIIELSATDFRIQAQSSLWLDDGWLAKSASLTTPQGVHWYQGDRYPHAGRVRIAGYKGWVELTFSETGVSRNDSRGNRQYWSWSSLN